MIASRLAPAVIGILGVTFQAAIQLGDAGDLVRDLGIRIQVFEHVAGSGQQVDLVGGDQRAQGMGIVFDLGDALR